MRGLEHGAPAVLTAGSARAAAATALHVGHSEMKDVNRKYSEKLPECDDGSRYSEKPNSWAKYCRQG